MINLDISNVWGQLSLTDLLSVEADVSAAHTALDGGPEGEGDRWLTRLILDAEQELDRIRQAADRIRAQSEVCVVLGLGCCETATRAAMELLQGENRNLGRGAEDPVMLFAGNSLSTRQWNELTAYLEEKVFSLIVISRSGTTLESAIAFRSLRWMLERRHGTDEANRRIYAVTDPKEGAPHRMAADEKWETFAYPRKVGGQFCAVSAVGLLPMAAAGLDIHAIWKGARQALEDYGLRSFENPVWLYAAIRNLLYRKGMAAEVLSFWDPDMKGFSRWWQQLFAQSEGKNGEGLIPMPVNYASELYTMGQLLAQGKRNLTETMFRFDPPEKRCLVGFDWKDRAELNYLEGNYLSFVEETAAQRVISDHADRGISVMVLDCGELNEEKVGELFCFGQLCCALSAGILGADPHSHEWVTEHKREMPRLLGKPEPPETAPETDGEEDA